MNRQDAVAAAIARLKTAVRAEAYYAVGANRRFRAIERRRLRAAANAAMLVVLGAVALDVVAFVPIHGSEAGLIAGLNLAVGVTALGGLLALRGPGHAHPQVVVSVVSLGIVWASVAIGVLGSGLGTLGGGYLLILPVVVALVVPSRPWAHLLWLLAYALAACAFLVLAPPASLATSERADLVILFLVSIAASFVGSTLRFRGRAAGYLQSVATRALRQQAELQRRALSRVQADLERIVRLDQLTQVGNRLRLVEDLAVLRGRLHRTGESFGMLELDLDHFKAVNDRFGHLVGDTVLHDVAAIFKRSSRASDTVYRSGGEEFVVLLPGAGAAATAAAGERIRAAVEAASLENPANTPNGVVTVSVGGAVILPGDLGLTDSAWLERADRALYRAKAEGRNRIAMEAPQA